LIWKYGNPLLPIPISFQYGSSMGVWRVSLKAPIISTNSGWRYLAKKWGKFLILFFGI